MARFQLAVRQRTGGRRVAVLRRARPQTTCPGSVLIGGRTQRQHGREQCGIDTSERGSGIRSRVHLQRRACDPDGTSAVQLPGIGIRLHAHQGARRRTQENDDTNPPRIAPRNLFDLAVGDDDLFHGDRYKWSARVTVINLANKYALYNFLSTFSGTHYVTPRAMTGEIGFHF